MNASLADPSAKHWLRFALQAAAFIASSEIRKRWRDEMRLMQCHEMRLIHSLRHDTSLIWFHHLFTEINRVLGRPEATHTGNIRASTTEYLLKSL
jgi:hypothetical protein